MFDMTGNPITHIPTSPREAIADTLHRCVLGIDSNDRNLLESACLMNEEMTFIAGPIVAEGWSAVQQLFEKVFVLVTTHITSNVRIQHQDGANTASMTAHAISYHVRPDDAFKQEDTSYTAFSLYSIDLVKDGEDGLWKIKKWEAQVLWTMGDKAVLHG